MSNDWFNGNGAGNPVDVAAVLDGLPMQGLREIVEAGALVSIGTTRDGGALGVTVTVDGDWKRDYFRDQAELLAWIAQALPAVEAKIGGKPPSPVPASRTRPSRKR